MSYKIEPYESTRLWLPDISEIAGSPLVVADTTAVKSRVKSINSRVNLFLIIAGLLTVEYVIVKLLLIKIVT
jgi:hypothetical protein